MNIIFKVLFITDHHLWNLIGWSGTDAVTGFSMMQFRGIFGALLLLFSFISADLQILLLRFLKQFGSIVQFLGAVLWLPTPLRPL